MFNMSPAQCANMNELVGTLVAKVKDLGPSPVTSPAQSRLGFGEAARPEGRS
jgi:hypothetical protein